MLRELHYVCQPQHLTRRVKPTAWTLVQPPSFQPTPRRPRYVVVEGASRGDAFAAVVDPLQKIDVVSAIARAEGWGLQLTDWDYKTGFSHARSIRIQCPNDKETAGLIMRGAADLGRPDMWS